MSFQAMAWAVKQELPTKEKFVLIMLANRASNDEGDCYPSIATLSKETALSRDSVMRAIKSLEDRGFLKVVRRVQDGVNLPNFYTLNLRGVVAHSDQGSSTQRLGVVAHSDSNLSIEPINESISHGNAVEDQEHVAADAATNAPAKPKLNPQTLVDLYHEHCPELPTIAKLTPKREAALRARWLDASRLPNRYRCGDIAAGLDWWQAFFEVVGESDFLNGRQKNSSWRADFDWLLKPSNFFKIIEGNYNNRTGHER